MSAHGMGQGLGNRPKEPRENPIEYRGIVLFLILMEMASSEVEMAPSQTFSCLLRDRSRHEKCIREDDSNNVRTVQTVFEKNLKVFVRDHLDREAMEYSSRSPVSDRKQTRESQILQQVSSNSLSPSPSVSISKQFCDPGQPENPSRNEVLGASSLVQIWEARLQHPNSGQSQALTDSRTTSGLSQTENSNSCSESLNEEIVDESDGIQLLDEGNNRAESDSGSQSEKNWVSDLGEKERERVRVLDIIRKLSIESETNNDNGSLANNDSVGTSNKEVQTMEQRSFPQVACGPRIRGRQAYEDLLMYIVRDRQKELAWLLDRNAVSKFTFRGRLQTMLKIRCLERCLAIQDRHRSKSAAPDVTRSQRGLVLVNLRDKFKTEPENSRVANVVEARSPSGSVSSSRMNEGGGHYTEASTSRFKVCSAEETEEKNVLPETTGKSNSWERSKKAENSRVDSRSSSSSVSARVNEGSGHHPEGSSVKESRLPLQETAEKNVLQEKTNSQERREANFGVPEVVKKAVLTETAETKTSPKKTAEKKIIQQKTKEEKRGPQEKSEENDSMRIFSEKVNLWSSKEKTSSRKTPERTEGEAIPQIVEKKAIFQEVERRIVNVETAERNIASKEIVENITLREAKQCNSVENGRTERGEANSAEAKSRESGNRKNPQEDAETPCLHKPVEEEETTIHICRERTIGTNCSQDGKNGMEEGEDKKNEKNECTENGENQESSTETCLPLESMESVNSWDESGTAEDDEEVDDHEEEQYADYDSYNVYSTYDWINEISRPRSYWEDLRKQWYLEVLNTDSPKEDIRRLIERRTVSDFLSSDLREKIDRLMISRAQQQTLDLDRNPREEELTERWTIPRSEIYQDNREEKQEESVTEQEHDKTTIQEAASDSFSQSSARSTMMLWSFGEQEVGDDQDPVSSPSLPAPSPSHRSQLSSFLPSHGSSPEMQMISDLKSQMDQLQREMIELRSSIKSCIDMQLLFQKSVKKDSCSDADQRGDATSPLKRKCSVCYEMPVDSLLYRCGHMCTCLKCAHELQWNSRKCPICMAPIVDVVRAFL
ncbi:PREDICTED: uncharacterized protein LOC104811913 [Tarenaya hassleriana]|uniref:uncharacterized protein LOC104811913 n=1 Tax=Tarenaya hassleriana TaxID=28532 RepID=UPI00053C9E7A|nr:PREDICTED: uncharacterized protein LOC104811913 [Tarenaya hassleriana]